MTPECPSADTLQRLVSDELTEAEETELSLHLDRCASCRELADSLSDDPELRKKYGAQGGFAPWEALTVCLQQRWGQLYSLGADPGGPQTTQELSSGPEAASPEPSRRASSPPPSAASDGVPFARQGFLEIGRLKLRRVLGMGGFGLTFLADDPLLRRQVAVKLPRGLGPADPASRKRFLREARAAARLRHPNIVPVYGAGEVGDLCYVMSAYCPGPNLAQWLADHRNPEQNPRQGPVVPPCPPVSPQIAARIVIELAEATEHAHQNGVLHCDIKPGNVLLEPKLIEDDPFPFVPMLCDFGLARLHDDEPTGTVSANVLGTPNYMAPEQAVGRLDEIGPPTDVYALGTILYELLTGQPSIPEKRVPDVLRRLLHEDLPGPRRLVPSLSRDLEAICLKCLQKSGKQRYGSAGALAEDLRRYLAHEPTKARPVTWVGQFFRWAQRRPALAGLVLVSLLGMVALIVGLELHNLAHDRLKAELEASLDRAQRLQEELQEHDLQVEQLLYEADMKLAVQAWRRGDLAELHALLEKHLPKQDQPDVRGPQWHELWGLVDGIHGSGSL